MDLKKWFNLDWNFIDVSEGFKAIIHGSIITFPLTSYTPITYEKLLDFPLSQDEVGIYLIDTGLPYKGEKKLFSIGIDVNIGEIGGIIIFALRPYIGLYSFYETFKIFKQHLIDKGKGIMVYFPEFEIEMKEYIKKTLKIKGNYFFAKGKRERIINLLTP